MRKKLRTWAIVLIAGATAIGLSLFGAQSLLSWALEREARLIGMDWAHHIERQLANLTEITHRDDPSNPNSVPDISLLYSLIDDVFEIGHMYQFDYINVNCHCHISLNTVPPTDAAADPHAGHNHGNGDNPATTSSFERDTANGQVRGTTTTQMWRHVFTNTAQHPPPPMEEADPYQYPVNRATVTRIITEQSHGIILRQNVSTFLPSTFAEVYHPVFDGAELTYMMRILVNLENQALFYRQFFWIAIALSLLTLAAAIGYPTHRYVVAARHKQTADKRVEYLANYDILTGVHNRNSFQDTIPDLLHHCKENNHSALLIALDLNGFKGINDYHGHPVGDQVLRQFAHFLKQNVPTDSYIARLGGDEFVVVVSDIPKADFNYQDYFQLAPSLSVNIHEGNQRLKLGISGGIVRFPQDAETAKELLQLADLALYAAKSTPSGELREFSPDMKADFFHRLKTREEFREALNQSQIEPYYQPIVNMHSGTVEGVEALARWNHPEKGLLTPFSFLEALQDSDLSAKLGQVMFEKIVTDMAEWQRLGIPFRHVGINITDGDLKQSTFAASIVDGLESHGLKPSNLTIEVTENCLFGPEKHKFIDHLECLRNAGCAIALDDFGTGFSSITQLKELPVTSIKIDKSFVDDVIKNQDDRSIISAMLALGNSMDFNLVMEGVETQQQLDLLKQMGAELVQGYYYSRPVSASEIAEFISHQNQHSLPGTNTLRAI
ncbi:putative bifunctional diguanylate cyclase/phosphodiesterase [Aestuariibius sp. HNIBRBA575]|uniref:putative bifunctional diguanylate cyclase/phosphodiesterase n=1 Tax=Aestuariibius sp. HNIBRBA575 TaxID=3233343 RepID=UPI0034A4792E